ncbi:hypothetical protein DFH28DRAFT_1062324 [Melampsora americana]|nr:hypothetical protein DFH28DRAFT_1062324 [Melampsora americana]
MSYFVLNSPLMFGINLWHVVKSTITRTQAKLEHSKTVPCSILDIATKSNPVIETSLVCASRYEVRSLSCQPLAAPSAILEICHPVVAIAEVESKELLQPEPLLNDKASSPIDNLLALGSLCESTPSNYTLSKSNTEPTEIHPDLESSSSKSNCSPSSFLAFLEASHLEMLERLGSEQPKSATSDLGCAQFNSAYYRRHPPPSLPQLKVHRPSKKPFCWKSKLDEIMRESGEECEDPLDLEEFSAEIDQDLPGSSFSNSPHSRSSSISSDHTCVESPEVLLISASVSITLPHLNTLSQSILDMKPILPSKPSLLSSTPSTFLAFLESSNLEMLKRMQQEKSSNLTLDIGCAQFNSAYYRRHPPPSLPQLKEIQSSKKPFCWRTTLDQMMQDEDCEDVSTEIVNETPIRSNALFPSLTHDSGPHVRSSSCSSNITCVEETPTSTSFPKHNVSLSSPLQVPLALH